MQWNGTRYSTEQEQAVGEMCIRIWRLCFFLFPQGWAVSWTLWKQSHRSWTSLMCVMYAALCDNQTVRVWNRWIVTFVQLLHFLYFLDVRDMKLEDIIFKLRLFLFAQWSLCSGSAGQSVCWKHVTWHRLQSWNAFLRFLLLNVLLWSVWKRDPCLVLVSWYRLPSNTRFYPS